MAGLMVSWEDLKQRHDFHRPHVVILGAGASRAAFPEGERHGRLLPLMNDLARVLELEDSLDAYDFPRGANFEEVYSAIAGNRAYAALQELIEQRVCAYFGSLNLPDAPTIYDYLVLSLREKDYIATFNWDPFLHYALWRNNGVVSLPKSLYLHGCAVLGCCVEHRVMGPAGQPCHQCGRPFEVTPLLYPVEEKDYTTDPFIAAQWQSVRFAMSQAWLFTVFGYGAPASDTAAIDLLAEAWGAPEARALEEIEIIDVRTRDELEVSWSRFIHTHHFRTTDDYFSSLLSSFPRRTCEAMGEQLLEANFLAPASMPRFETLPELQGWMLDIAEHESSRVAESC